MRHLDFPENGASYKDGTNTVEIIDPEHRRKNQNDVRITSVTEVREARQLCFPTAVCAKIFMANIILTLKIFGF